MYALEVWTGLSAASSVLGVLSAFFLMVFIIVHSLLDAIGVRGAGGGEARVGRGVGGGGQEEDRLRDPVTSGALCT